MLYIKMGSSSSKYSLLASEPPICNSAADASSAETATGAPAKKKRPLIEIDYLGLERRKPVTMVKTVSGYAMLGQALHNTNLREFPGISPRNELKLGELGIRSPKQLFGLYLQFQDPDDFIDFLEGHGLKFVDVGRSELLALLAIKWELAGSVKINF